MKKIWWGPRTQRRKGCLEKGCLGVWGCGKQEENEREVSFEKRKWYHLRQQQKETDWRLEVLLDCRNFPQELGTVEETRVYIQLYLQKVPVLGVAMLKAPGTFEHNVTSVSIHTAFSILKWSGSDFPRQQPKAYAQESANLVCGGLKRLNKITKRQRGTCNCHLHIQVI